MKTFLLVLMLTGGDKGGLVVDHVLWFDTLIECEDAGHTLVAAASKVAKASYGCVVRIVPPPQPPPMPLKPETPVPVPPAPPQVKP